MADLRAVLFDELAATLRQLLDAVEGTAKNSFSPSFIETPGGRKEIPWQAGWRLDDPEQFDICRRARNLLAKVDGR